MHERRVERVLIALPWMPCRRACALCPTACAPVCAPRSTNGPLLSRAGGCDKLRRCHRDDERIVLRLRVTVRVESARAAECALSVARQNAQIRNLVVCKRGSTTGVSRLRTRLHLCPRVVGRRHHSRESGRGLDSNHYYVLFYAVLTSPQSRPSPPGPRGRFRWELTRTGLSGMRQDIYQCWWGASPSPLAMWRTNSDCRYRYGRETAGSKRVLLSCSLALRVRLVDSFSDRQVADSETD